MLPTNFVLIVLAYSIIIFVLLCCKLTILHQYFSRIQNRTSKTASRQNMRILLICMTYNMLQAFVTSECADNQTGKQTYQQSER